VREHRAARQHRPAFALAHPASVPRWSSVGWPGLDHDASGDAADSAPTGRAVDARRSDTESTL